MKYRYTKRLAPVGYVAIDRPSAKLAYEEGYVVTICGNNVNRYHVFDGWHLGYSFSRLSEADWEATVSSFMSHLDKELGRYPVFYIRKEVFAEGKE